MNRRRRISLVVAGAVLIAGALALNLNHRSRFLIGGGMDAA